MNLRPCGPVEEPGVAQRSTAGTVAAEQHHIPGVGPGRQSCHGAQQPRGGGEGDDAVGDGAVGGARPVDRQDDGIVRRSPRRRHVVVRAVHGGVRRRRAGDADALRPLADRERLLSLGRGGEVGVARLVGIDHAAARRGRGRWVDLGPRHAVIEPRITEGGFVGAPIGRTAEHDHVSCVWSAGQRGHGEQAPGGRGGCRADLCPGRAVEDPRVPESARAEATEEDGVAGIRPR